MGYISLQEGTPSFFISEFFHRTQEFLSDTDASLVFEGKGAKIASHVAT